MCDESWALALADAQRRGTGRVSLPYYLGASAGLYLTWVVFTGLGAALGPVIGDVEKFGFDMAFTAVFLVLLRSMWRGMRASLPWLVSLGVAALTYRLMPQGAWYVAAGTMAGLASAALTAPGNRSHDRSRHPGDHRPDGRRYYLTRILGYLALRNRVLQPHACATCWNACRVAC
jgi:predicted branched-subunit amino acid permease